MIIPAERGAVDEGGCGDAESVHVEHGDEEGERLQDAQGAVDDHEVAVRALRRRLVRAADPERNKIPLQGGPSASGKKYVDKFQVTCKFIL